MTRGTRWAALVLLSLVALVGSGSGTASAGPSPGDEFYVPPRPLPDGKSGDLIRSRPIVAPAFPGAYEVWHILYRSSDNKGLPIAMSGTVLIPRASSAGPRPIVVLTPGARGIADKCAPSKQYQLSTASPEMPDYEIPVVAQLLARGIAVAVTDYQGAGTPGLTSSFVGRPQGYAGLDAVRAAQRLPATGLTSDGPVGFYGYSQGGQAAGWAAEIQPEYAPELNVKGVALGGILSDMNVQANHWNGTRFAGFAFAALSRPRLRLPGAGPRREVPHRQRRRSHGPGQGGHMRRSLVQPWEQVGRAVHERPHQPRRPHSSRVEATVR